MLKSLIAQLLAASFLVTSAQAEIAATTPSHAGKKDSALDPEKQILSLSSVAGKKSQNTQVKISNKLPSDIPTTCNIIGKDAEFFSIVKSPKKISANSFGVVEIAFNSGKEQRLYSAVLQIGTTEGGCMIQLQGVGLAAFEGKNEPPLQQIVNALGIAMDVGGKTLSLNSKKATIGDSVAASYFRVAKGAHFHITPIARFSPPGKVPVGLIFKGSDSKQGIGQLVASSKDFPDAHQCLFPKFIGHQRSIQTVPTQPVFGFYMEGHKYVSVTDPTRQKGAPIMHTARIYPVKSMQGRSMKNAWLLGFEEASNGDYQDAVFLLENVIPVTAKD
ncbi:hypothetical protein NT6N_19370 [Oceaniferula spumae]|uniref:DUF4861 domain-containing protein n=1 Tax=Oceaniferula spumae TaxID=2979115 RepID=A0AAT9FLR8_9BACT